MSNLAEKFAINCKSDTPAKSSRYGGRAQAMGHVRAMLDDVRSAHFAAKHRIQRYLNSNDARLAAADLAPSRHETAASESPAPLSCIRAGRMGRDNPAQVREAR